MPAPLSPTDTFRWGVEPWAHIDSLLRVVVRDTVHKFGLDVELRLRAGAPMHLNKVDGSWSLIGNEHEGEFFGAAFSRSRLGGHELSGHELATSWPRAARAHTPISVETAPAAEGLLVSWGPKEVATLTWADEGSARAHVSMHGECYELDYVAELHDRGHRRYFSRTSCGGRFYCSERFTLPQDTTVYWSDGSYAGSTREKFWVCADKLTPMWNNMQCASLGDYDLFVHASEAGGPL